MQIGKAWGTFLIFLAASAIYGCGGGVSGSSVPASVASHSKRCVECHSDRTSAGTGALIINEWNASIHKQYNAAGCNDCHEAPSNHGCGSCHGGSSGPSPIANPDAAGKCYNCHDGVSTIKPLTGKHLSASAQRLPPPFGNLTSALRTYTNSAGYAVLRGTPYESRCNWCHNPHDNTNTEQHRQWAESGHGEPSAEPFLHYDFKVRGSFAGTPANSAATDCVRCHTTTGYINYVTSGFTDIRPWGAQVNAAGSVITDPRSKSPSPGDNVRPISNQKQVIYCNVCHDDGSGRSYGFRIRSVPRVTGYYNLSTSHANPGNPTANVYYNSGSSIPDASASNICLVCHVGKEAGGTIKGIPAAGGDFTKKIDFVNSHYLTAGATLFKTSGYEYPLRSYANAANYLHDTIGISAAGTGNSGPCVTCHMKPRRHSFLPVVKDESDNLISLAEGAVCSQCHSVNPNAVAPSTSFNGRVADTTPAYLPYTLTTRKQGYQAAMDVLQAMLKKKGWPFLQSHPYFAATTWNNEGNMGAAFNFNLLYHDYGAYAHNSLYVRRLIFDSIEWLQYSSLDPDPNTPSHTVKATFFDADGAGIIGESVKDVIAGKPPRTVDLDTLSMASAWLFGTGTKRP